RELHVSTRYTARANAWSTDHGATLEAMDDGTGAGTGCALALWWEESRLRADEAGLARMVDDAVLWGVVRPGEAEALLARLAIALQGVGRCRPRFDLALDASNAARAVATLAATGTAGWAAHAARALPRNAREPGRLDCAAREALNAAPLAAVADLRGPALRTALAEALRPVAPRLAARERAGVVPWTCWQVLRQAGLATRGPGTAWRARADAAAGLSAVLARGGRATPLDPADWRVLAEAAEALRPAFEQPFTLRTLASMFGRAAPGTARLSIAHVRDGAPMTLLVAG